MLKKLVVIALLSFYLLLYGSPTASAIENACTTSSYLVVHINGINTSHEDAMKNISVLALVVGETYENEKIEFLLAENKTNKFWSDLKDVFVQKLNEYPDVSSELVFKALVDGVVSSLLPERFRQFATSYHVNKIKDSGFVNYSDDDLKDIVSAIRAKMTENQKVLLVPHSQGNLYANAAYAALTTGTNAVSSSAIKIMGVASPASYVAGSGDYLTSSNDMVIAALRSSGLSVLGSNFTIAASADDTLGHSFADIYLNASHEGRAEVIRKIHAVMDSLTFPGGGGSQGPITVTLTWGAQPDIDLHVLEPDGAHVYYINKSGGVGYLDLDDTNGFGPEHYYTECDRLKVGTYTIGVNYFWGTAPETATITIATPVSILTRSVHLSEVRTSSGNDSPVRVATVTVGKTSTGRFTFAIN